MELNCPNCKDESERCHAIRIQNSDDLNADPNNTLGTVELWYCNMCGQYFRVYYRIVKICKLQEVSENES